MAKNIGRQAFLCQLEQSNDYSAVISEDSEEECEVECEVEKYPLIVGERQAEPKFNKLKEMDWISKNFANFDIGPHTVSIIFIYIFCLFICNCSVKAIWLSNYLQD